MVPPDFMTSVLAVKWNLQGLCRVFIWTLYNYFVCADNLMQCFVAAENVFQGVVKTTINTWNLHKSTVNRD